MDCSLTLLRNEPHILAWNAQSNDRNGRDEKVSAAVVGYGVGGAITSRQKADANHYRALAGRLGKVNKSGVLVAPELVRIDAKDVLSEPSTLKDVAAADVRHHFLRSPGARME